MSSGAEPIPVKDPDSLKLADAVVKEAFRQGWESARHWPNHPLPKHLFVKMDSPDPDTIVLRIEWP